MGFQIHTSGSGPVSPWGTARANFYGVGGIPDVRVDGVLQQLGSYGSDPANYSNMLSLANQRWAVPTDVTLELYASPVSGQTYMITAIVGIEPGGVGKTMKLHLAQALAFYPYDPTQPYPQYNNGIIQGFDAVQFSLDPGQTQTFFQEITFDATSWANQDDIRILGTLQEPAVSGSAETYQADIIPYPFPQLSLCPCDINGDETVDVLDLLALLAAWGNTGGPEDVNGDGTVDVLDLLELLSAWGPCPAQPTGACCIGIDCVGTYNQYDCVSSGGFWYEGEECPGFVCPVTYCEATSQSCNQAYVSNVLFGDIDHTSDCGMYQDWTAISNTMAPGASQNITITNPVYWAGNKTSVWVDWNQDGEFDGAGEEFAFGDPAGNITNGVITAPGDALLGETRMRIRIQLGGTPEPCGVVNYGEVEDYTINVVE